MKTLLQLFISLMIINACGQTTAKKQLDVQTVPYANFLQTIQSKKKTFTDIKEAKQYLFEIFNNHIPQYWIGTK